MKYSLLSEATRVNGISYLISAILIASIAIPYPILYNQYDKVASLMVTARNLSPQLISYIGNASSFSNVSNLDDANIPLGGVISTYPDFVKIQIPLSVNISYANSSESFVTFLFHNFFPTDYPYPSDSVTTDFLLIARLFTLTNISTTLISAQVQPNGLDIYFTLFIQPDTPPQATMPPYFGYVTDPVFLKYIIINTK